jgi:hypothetical protein
MCEKKKNECRRQGCQIFLGTIYQNGVKYTKWSQNIPIGHKIFPMVVKYSNTMYSFRGPPKFTQIGKLGMPSGNPGRQRSKQILSMKTFDRIHLVME